MEKILKREWKHLTADFSEVKDFFRILFVIMLILSLPVHMVIANGENTSWVCPECGRTGNTGNYCGSCAHPAPSIVEQASIEIGNILRFGCYEQDGNVNNGKEPIEWIVLDCDKTEGKALLISKYGLDAKPYNDKTEKVVWEQCTLRGWLNGEFLQSAFSAEEQSAILITVVDNSASQGYSEWKTDGGNNTRDKIFLLSYAEVNRYLLDYADSSDTRTRVVPTVYAVMQGAWKGNDFFTDDGEAIGWWWLRSPGYYVYDKTYVINDGSYYEEYVNSVGAVNRPAFWLNLNSDILK